MSKPRIVRENENAPYDVMHEIYHGPAYLALPWPKECPWTPEQVMAACERRGLTLSAIPCRDMGTGMWWVRTRSMPCTSEWTENLTPDFIGEPKPKCDSPMHGCVQSGFVKCPSCGAILSDRRKGEERRKSWRRYACVDFWGRRMRPGDRRTGGKDRRKS